MRTDDQHQTVTVSSSSAMFSISSSEKYAGMIQQTPLKRARNSLFQLFDYVAQTSPPFWGIHSFITIWRLILIFAPSLCATYSSFWGKDSLIFKTLNVVAIIYQFLPVSSRGTDAPTFFILICSLIFIIYFIGIGAAAAYYSVNAKLGKIVSPIISLSFGTFGYILPPIMSGLAVEMIGHMIVDPTFISTLRIVTLVIFLLTIAFYIYLYSHIYSVTILFKPDSLMCVAPTTSTYIAASPIIFHVLISLGTYLPFIVRAVCQGLCSLLYFGSIFLLFYKGGLVSKGNQQAAGASYITGGVMNILVIIFELVGINGNEILFVGFFALWIISYFMFSWIMQIRTKQILEKLDSLQIDHENFALYKSPDQLVDHAVVGFRYAHPICLSFEIFKYGVEQWPKQIVTWFAYAKFIAIYPEELPQLSLVTIGVINNRIKGYIAKHMISQIGAIAKQREPNLVPELKSKLDKVSKQVQATKHKVRYIWDLIIQGNIKELESVIDRAYQSIDQCEAEFLHLVRMYPNSRFVARSYARFLRDVSADQAEHQKWMQNVSLLQRGVPVMPDQTHDLGLLAFPLLPKQLTTDTTMNIMRTMTDDTLTIEIDPDDESSTIDAELRLSVRESINKLSIPSLRHTRIAATLMVFIFVCVTVIAMTYLIPVKIDEISTPLEYMYQSATLRMYIYQIIGHSFHYVGENAKGFTFSDRETGATKDYIPLDPPLKSGTADVDYEEIRIESTYQYLSYGLDMTAAQIPKLSPLMSYRSGDEAMDLVRESLFGHGLTIKQLDDNGNPISVDRSITDFAGQLVIIGDELLHLDNTTFGQDIFNQNQLYFMVMNLKSASSAISDTLDKIVGVIATIDEETKSLMNLMIYIIVPIIAVAFIIALIFEIITISKDKLKIYKCLASLPKNVVCHVADTFKVLKKEEDDETHTTHTSDDVNKQEENMLKIFATTSDSSSRATDAGVILFTNIAIAAFGVAVTCCTCTFLNTSVQTMTNAAPHVDLTTSAYSFSFCSCVLVHMLACANAGAVVANFNHDVIVSTYFEWEERATNSYQHVRYGSVEEGIVPFASLGDGLLIEGEVEDGCDEILASQPTNFHQSYGCWPGDALNGFATLAARKLVLKDDSAETDFVLYGDEDMLKHLWHMQFHHLYDKYYSIMFSSIIPLVNEILNSGVPLIIGGSWGMLAASFVMLLILLISLSETEKREKFALRLLLHCPGSVVLSNAHITTLLAGNFSEKAIDSTTRNAEFYDILVQDLPDAIFIMDLEGNIQITNKAVSRIFGNHDLEGKPIGEFFNELGIKPENPFSSTIPLQGFEKQYSFNNGSQEIYIELVFTPIAENLLVSCRNISQMVNYNQLISDERAKSDGLLASILPPKLVPRVQAGEKNISFAVQSATIVFMDIVSFTPWCGSNTADYVMKTLNQIYKQFDINCALQPTMTKIKCIGDCYMGAGGIFAEINQPAVHAKEVVDFGLDCIQSIYRLDEQLSESLQIRVGINTGGPIVAGVLGTEKPTFEILGPAIQMAQQMEHNGLPMKVHVSRAVYELIYGGNFDVKERGEISVKKGKVVTYIVNGHKE